MLNSYYQDDYANNLGEGGYNDDYYYGVEGYGGGGYPPISLPPVRPYPPDPFINQFPLPEALRRGTLFCWLYDPYVDPYRQFYVNPYENPFGNQVNAEYVEQEGD